MLVWLEFFFLTLVITYFGFQLSKLGDEIAEKSKLGRNLVGLILLSTVTSLPELVTGISSVSITSNSNLAVGDILGSCCFNLVTVVLLDLFYRKGSVYSRSTQGHILMCLLGVILIGFLGMALALKDVSWMQFGGVGIYSLIIPIIYLVSMATMYKFETEASTKDTSEKVPLGVTLWKFIGCSLVIIGAGIFLPQTSEKIIHLMGWNAAFMGTFFVALATSLPEIAVTFSALRLNAAELAFSNLLGSNIFNIMIISIDDIFYKKGHLLADTSDSHLITAFTALMMTGLVAIALLKPPQKKFINIISGLSILIILLYILNLGISYQGTL